MRPRGLERGILATGHNCGSIAVIKAFIDESGFDGRGDELVVAAAVGKQHLWAAFAADWQRWARGFHAQTADEQTKMRLAEVAVDLVDSIVVCVFNDAHYKRDVSHDVRSLVGGMYTYGLISTMNAVHHLVPTAEVGYFIEPGARGYSNAIAGLAGLYANTQARQHLRIATFGPANHSDDLPLHVADLVAHEAFTWLRSGRPPYGGSQPLKILQRKLHLYGSDSGDLIAFNQQFSDLLSMIRHHKRNQKASARAIRRGIIPAKS